MTDPVLENERKVRNVAGRILRRNDDRFDDMLQEGLIAFWETCEGDEERVGLGLHAARLRMRHMVATAPQRPFQPTGHAPLPGHVSVKTIATLDQPVGDSGRETIGTLLAGSDDPLDGIEMAYHRGELAEALAALRPEDKAYVVRRFWGGRTDSEIAREEETRPSTIHNRWARRIRPALLDRLEHLRVA